MRTHAPASSIRPAFLVAGPRGLPLGLGPRDILQLQQ